MVKGEEGESRKRNRATKYLDFWGGRGERKEGEGEGRVREE